MRLCWIICSFFYLYPGWKWRRVTRVRMKKYPLLGRSFTISIWFLRRFSWSSGKKFRGIVLVLIWRYFYASFNHYCGVLNSITCLCIWGVGRLTFFFSFIVNILCKYDVILLFLGNLRVNRRNNCFQNILVFLYNIIFLFLRALRFRSKFLGFFRTVTGLAFLLLEWSDNLPQESYQEVKRKFAKGVFAENIIEKLMLSLFRGKWKPKEN